jgi:hypothetical protein
VVSVTDPYGRILGFLDSEVPYGLHKLVTQPHYFCLTIELHVKQGFNLQFILKK